MTLAEKQTLFTQFAQTHHPFFLKFLATKVPYSTTEDKEDIIQEGLMRAALKIHTYDPEQGEMSTWLLRIIRNCALSWYQFNHRAKRDANVTFSVDVGQRNSKFDTGDSYSIAECFGNFRDEYDDKESWQWKLIQESMDEMTPARRRFIELSYIQQLTNNEIAALDNTTYSNVTSKINQATAILREKVQRKWRQLQ